MIMTIMQLILLKLVHVVRSKTNCLFELKMSDILNEESKLVSQEKLKKLAQFEIFNNSIQTAMYKN